MWLVQAWRRLLLANKDYSEHVFDVSELVRRIIIIVLRTHPWVLRCSPQYVHQCVATNSTSSVLRDDFFHACGASLILGDTYHHSKFTQSQYWCRFTSHKVLYSSNIPEVVNDFNMIQWLTFWFSSNTSQSVCSFIISNASVWLEYKSIISAILIVTNCFVTCYIACYISYTTAFHILSWPLAYIWFPTIWFTVWFTCPPTMNNNYS